MQALTLHEPWAWAFADAGKMIENRNWRPTLVKGEVIAICAGVKYDQVAAERLSGVRAIAVRLLVDHGVSEPFPAVPPKSDLVLGAVAAVARFYRVATDLVPGDPQEFWRGDDRFVWIFDKVWKLPTRVPCRGRQKLWRLPEDVEAEVTHQWAKCPGGAS